MHPAWFIAFGVLWLLMLVFVWALARMSALADADAELLADRDLLVPAGVTAAVEDRSSPPPGVGSCRDGQRAAAQERAARAALRPGPSGVEVAPRGCPVERRP
jgi:hypothetical protein